MREETEASNVPSVEEMIERYGVERLLQEVDATNALLAVMAERSDSFSAAPQSAGYQQEIDRLMEATRAYYTYLSDLPDDLRLFLMFFPGWSPDMLQKGADAVEQQLLRKIEQARPMIQAIRPRQYIMAVDPLSNRLPQLQEENLIFVGKHGRQPVRTAVSVECPEHMKIDGNINLSTYDKSIINGVSSILESGNSSFSIPMLYHAMTGKANPTVDDQLFGEIQQKLDKMRRLMITIDLSEEFKANFIGDDGMEHTLEELSIEGYLLPLNKIRGVVNGKQSEMYQIIDTPPLYNYAKAKKQIAAVPIDLLNAPLNNNATTIPLKTYLLSRIEGMKNKNNKLRSDKILYSSIYEELDVTDANKTRKMRIRTYTKVILDHFVEQEYIRGYSEVRTGRTISGIRILL